MSEGVYSGLFSLNHDNNKDGSSRTLEIEIIWSNRMPDDETWEQKSGASHKAENARQ